MPLTKTQIETLIDTNLASGSNIPASKHREVEHAILDYVTNRIIGSGTATIGNVPSGDYHFDVTFASVGTSAYIVTGSLVSNSTDDSDNNVWFAVRDKTATGFKLLLREQYTDTQNMDFDYVLISK